MTSAPLTSGINTLAYPLPGILIDSAQIREEYERALASMAWSDQNRYRNKGWKGVALYAQSGRTNDLRVNYSLPPAITPVGEICPYICNQVLPQFKAPWFRAGFYKLEAGATIGAHRDLVHHAFSRTMVRIHIPVITDPRVVMYVAHQPYRLLWELLGISTRLRFMRWRIKAMWTGSISWWIFATSPDWRRSCFLRRREIGCGSPASPLQYYVNRLVKPVYSRTRNVWYGRIRKRSRNHRETA